MSENAVDNSGAQIDSGVTASAPVEVNQTETQGNTAQASAETKNTESANEYMIPKSRFDEVNNNYKVLKQKEDAFRAYEQFDHLLAEDKELRDEIDSILEKRKQKSQPAQNQRQDQPVNNIVNSLAQEVAYMKAERNVQSYSSEFEKAFASSGLPESARDLYKLHVEQNVLTQLNGELWRPYNSTVVKKAFEDAKQLLDPLVQKSTQSATQNVARNIPVSTPNAPMPSTRLRTPAERTAFIANRLRAGRQG